jgi:leader peptidase (prepilin peptidase)/N-methyltransferase
MTGVTLGFFGNIELLTLSLFFSAIVSVFLLVFRKVGKKKRIPFVPFTAIAYGVVMVL